MCKRSLTCGTSKRSYLENSVTHVFAYTTDFDTADGTCVRDYIHVMDLVEAHLLALRNFRQGVNRVYNVGIGKGYSVREFISACRNATGVDIKVGLFTLLYKLITFA